jgi:hypothetical protein
MPQTIFNSEKGKVVAKFEKESIFLDDLRDC